MNRADWFSIGMRLMGVWIILHALVGVADYVPLLFGRPTVLSLLTMVGVTLWHLVVGAALVVCAGWIAALFYPAREGQVGRTTV